MFRKSYLYLFLAAAISLAAQINAYAQMGPVNGTVVLSTADGKTVPVANAVIDVYRTDVKGGFPSAKTNKSGEFNFAGMLFSAEYAFAVSAPNCAPIIFPNVKAGQEKLVITLYPGDGHKFTEAEARKGAADAPKGGEANSGISEDEKKAMAELDKKNAEIMAKNEKMKNADSIAAKSNSEGNVAVNAENYDLAIAKFNEGIEAVPDYVGSTPIMLNGKMIALKGKAYRIYKEGATSADASVKTAKYAEANKLYDDALAAFQQGLAVIKAAAPAANPADQKQREGSTLALYTIATEVHRLKASVDSSKTAEANTVITEYIAMEPDAAKKINAQMALGDIFRRTGDLEKAVAAYRQVLVLKPDHADAMGSLGLSLFGQGASMMPEDKEMEQEGLNFMQKYIDLSPISPTDSQQTKELKASIKESVDYLKAQKMAPQKVAAPTPKKKN